MSRWTEQAKNNPICANLEALKSSLKTVNLSEDATVQEFEELARLKKVISYTDAMLDATDPELIPLGKWDEANPHVAACSNEVLNYVSSRNVGHLTQANHYADNILLAVKPIVTASGRSARALSDAAKEYSETLTKFFELYKNNATEALSEIRALKKDVLESERIVAEARQQIVSAKIEIVGDGQEQVGIVGELREQSEDIEDSHERITEFYNDLLADSEAQESKKSKVESAISAISEEAEKAKSIVSKSSELVKGFEAFYEKVFGKQEGEGEGRTGGQSGELNVMMSRMAEFESNQKVRYNALNTQIESLIPGATSAGLASAYREMKESFSAPIRFSGGVFYAAIAVLILGSIVMAVDSFSWSEGIRFKELGDWQSVLRSLAYKLPFYGPAVWLTYYASKRRSEYQRLQQEYAHKEALAKSYDSYKKQIEELDLPDNEMLIALLNRAIDAISHNASQTLDGRHGDKMPLQEALDKILDAAAKKVGAG